MKPGRDPLGLMTITEDRIMPTLLPGVLALSRRARYFSFYPFLLDEYARAGLRATREALSSFIKRREYEFAIAAHLCPNCDARAANGAINASRAVRNDPAAYKRGESVESTLGGYGLYYRTPLEELEVVAREGRLLGGGEDARPIPVDVVESSPRAHELAERFREAIADTRYYEGYFRGANDIPKDVLLEYAERSCLCRLADWPTERAAIRTVLFTDSREARAAETDQRRRSFALFLRLLDRVPEVADSEGAFRSAIWEDFQSLLSEQGPAAETSAQWAALVMKEYVQEAFASIWVEACRRGLAEQASDGMSRDQLVALLRDGLFEGRTLDLPSGTVSVRSNQPTVEASQQLLEATAAVSPEELRTWAAAHNRALPGLAFLLVVLGRLPHPDTAPRGWTRIGLRRSQHQPGLLRLAHYLKQHLAEGPALEDTMEWLVRSYVLVAHERIAYSKLPEFTFRFRWEAGRLVFYDNGLERFNPASSRRDAMSRVTEDLGFWERVNDTAVLTPDGRTFVSEVLE